MKPLLLALALVVGATVSDRSVGLQPDMDRSVGLQPDVQEQDWPEYGGDPGGTKFSPLTIVDRTNVAQLTRAWEWAPHEKALPAFGTRPGNFQATPLMIGNVLYLSTPYNRVVALNAETGAEVWSFDPKAYE